MPRKIAHAHELSIVGVMFVQLPGPREPQIPLYRGTCACRHWTVYAGSSLHIRLLFDHDHMADRDMS